MQKKFSNMIFPQADTNWMKRSIGISVHWTSHTVPLSGLKKNYQDAVRDFPVEAFADQLADAGADHCIFTLTHAEQYLPLPHPLLEKLLPGRTAERDMVGDLAEALAKRRIRFLAYYNHSCNGADDPIWKEACSYADGPRHDLDRFADIYCAMVEFIAGRYGNLIAGWWFDSPYSLDPRGPVNTISCDIGSWQFPWERLVRAAKSGYPECAVAINAGIDSRFLYTELQDYYAGETVSPDAEAVPEALPGIQDHRWICTDSPGWVLTEHTAEKGFCAPRFSDEVLMRFAAGNRSRERMTSCNLLIDQAGVINPAALAQFKRVRRKF